MQYLVHYYERQCKWGFVHWLCYLIYHRCYKAEITPIRRKTLSNLCQPAHCFMWEVEVRVLFATCLPSLKKRAVTFTLGQRCECHLPAEMILKTDFPRHSRCDTLKNPYLLKWSEKIKKISFRTIHCARYTKRCYNQSKNLVNVNVLLRHPSLNSSLMLSPRCI